VLLRDGEGERLNPFEPTTHGFLGDKTWKGALMTARCNKNARPGYNSMKAHEYMEDPEVLREKVRLLASLMKKSQATLAYTGAGISRASGIDDYATKTTASDRKALMSPLDALPTTAHKAMAQLYWHKYLHYWIQQNHDGLPQKAGYPQHALNEIHGAWYDPSNPVVKMDGQLRSDLFEDLLNWEQKADLVFAFGTSLAGMNADRLVTTCGEKAKNGKAIGPIIVNLQQTACDSSAALRIFAPLDQVLTMLVDELGCKAEDRKEDALGALAADTPGLWQIPYNEQGLKSSKHTTLDLRPGARLRIVSGPYVGSEGEVQGTNRQGHYKITFRVQLKKFLAPFPMVLGSWWVEAAVKGQVPALPVVTVTPAPSPSHDRNEEKQNEEHFASYCGRPVVLSGVSMADGGAPPKPLLDEITRRGKKF